MDNQWPARVHHLQLTRTSSVSFSILLSKYYIIIIIILLLILYYCYYYCIVFIIVIIINKFYFTTQFVIAVSFTKRSSFHFFNLVYYTTMYIKFTVRLRGPGKLLSNILFCLPAVRSSDQWNKFCERETKR